MKITVEGEARILAAWNIELSDTVAVYWFPDDSEIRLVAVSSDVPPEDEEDGELVVLYWRAMDTPGMRLPSGISAVRPQSFGKLKLPEGWGKWKDAVLLEKKSDLARS